MNYGNCGVLDPPAPGQTRARPRSRGILSMRDRSEEALIANIPWVEPSQLDPLRRLARHLMREASAWQIEQAQRRASNRGGC